jgi:hypothetical protein
MIFTRRAGQLSCCGLLIEENNVVEVGGDTESTNRALTRVWADGWYTNSSKRINQLPHLNFVSSFILGIY